jgi:hypothetical protein
MKFPALDGTQKLITVFTTAHYWSMSSETVFSSEGLGPESDCSGKAQCTSKLQTRPLVREGAPQQDTHICQKAKIWYLAPDGNLTVRQTDRLTIGCKLTSILLLYPQGNSPW